MTKRKRPACTEQVMLHLPPDLRDALEQAAEAEHRSLSFMARRAVERMLAEAEVELVEAKNERGA